MRRLRSASVMTVSAVTAALFCFLVLSSSSSIGPGVNAGQVHAVAVQYMNGSQKVTSAQAVATAKQFDFVIALVNVYPGYVKVMHVANPRLQLYVYAKGMFSYNAGLRESAYSHSASGARVRSQQFGTYLLNPVSADAVAAQTTYAKSQLSKSGYDGLFLDSMGQAAINPGFVTALPVNPATGKVWTLNDWLPASVSFASKIAASVPNPVMVNGLRDGTAYFRADAPSSQFLDDGLTGGLAEGWLRGALGPINGYPSETKWKQNVDAVSDAGSKSAAFVTMTKTWVSSTQTQKDAWLNYAAASFLLGNDGHAYFAFTQTQGDALTNRTIYHVDLGSASSAYAKTSGVYQREFTLGRVLVNPTGATFTIPLGKTYYTLQGVATTSARLSANTALILLDTPPGSMG